MKGRKRHLLVDTNGFLLQVLVHEANIQDYHGGKLLLEPLGGCFPRLKQGREPTPSAAIIDTDVYKLSRAEKSSHFFSFDQA